MMTKTILAALSTGLLLLTSCQPSVHPNQISDFDGKTYDAMLLAHTALATLRDTVSVHHRDLIPQFNSTAMAYSATFDAYAIYRTAPLAGAPRVSALLIDLAASMQGLERGLTNHLPVAPDKAAEVRQKFRAQRQRLGASRPRYEMSLLDILTALQASAQIARLVPVASPYATVALLVIDATKSAVENAKHNSGKPIDLALLLPIAAI